MTHLQAEYVAVRGELDSIQHRLETLARLEVDIEQREAEIVEAKDRYIQVCKAVNLTKPLDSYAAKGGRGWRNRSHSKELAHAGAEQVRRAQAEVTSLEEGLTELQAELKGRDNLRHDLNRQVILLSVALDLANYQLDKAAQDIPKDHYCRSKHGASYVQSILGLLDGCKAIRAYWYAVEQECRGLNGNFPKPELYAQATP